MSEIPDFLYRVSAGNVAGSSAALYQGVNGAVTTTHRTLWGNSSLYAFLAVAATTPTISSSDANDTAAGTGARTVRITGVNGSFAVVTEVLTLNGQTGVSIVGSYMTITNIQVVTAGSGGTGAGVIYVGTGSVTSGVPAVVHGYLEAGRNNQPLSLIGCVPASYRFTVYGIAVQSASITAGAGEVQLRTTVNLGLKTVPYVNGFLNTGGPLVNFLPVPIILAEKTQWQVTVSCSAGTGPVYGQLVGVLTQTA